MIFPNKIIAILSISLALILEFRKVSSVKITNKSNQKLGLYQGPKAGTLPSFILTSKPFVSKSKIDSFFGSEKPAWSGEEDESTHESFNPRFDSKDDSFETYSDKDESYDYLLDCYPGKPCHQVVQFYNQDGQRSPPRSPFAATTTTTTPRPKTPIMSGSSFWITGKRNVVKQQPSYYEVQRPKSIKQARPTQETSNYQQRQTLKPPKFGSAPEFDSKDQYDPFAFQVKKKRRTGSMAYKMPEKSGIYDIQYPYRNNYAHMTDSRLSHDFELAQLKTEQRSSNDAIYNNHRRREAPYPTETKKRRRNYFPVFGEESLEDNSVWPSSYFKNPPKIVNRQNVVTNVKRNYYKERDTFVPKVNWDQFVNPWPEVLSQAQQTTSSEKSPSWSQDWPQVTVNSYGQRYGWEEKEVPRKSSTKKWVSIDVAKPIWVIRNK